MKKIMITGATGGLGGKVLEILQKKTSTKNIYALARDTSKLKDEVNKGVTAIEGDYNDSASLVKAFSGIDTLYFVSGNDVPKRLAQHQNVVKAAIDAKVKHVIYTSFQRKTETADSAIAPVADAHIKTEQLLKESGLNYTILKHALYSNVIPMLIGDEVLDKGMIYFPAGEGKVSFTSRNDMAEAAALILTSEGHENKTYEIASNHSYGFDSVAEILSKLSGKQVKYISPTNEEYTKALTSAGVPSEFIGFMSMFANGINQGEFDFPDSTLEKIIAHEPQSLEQYLKETYIK